MSALGWDVLQTNTQIVLFSDVLTQSCDFSCDVVVVLLLVEINMSTAIHPLLANRTFLIYAHGIMLMDHN